MIAGAAKKGTRPSAPRPKAGAGQSRSPTIDERIVGGEGSGPRAGVAVACVSFGASDVTFSGVVVTFSHQWAWQERERDEKEKERAFLAEKASMSLASGSWGRRRRWRGKVSPSTLGCSRDRWNFRKCCSHFLAAAPCHCGWWRHSKSWPSHHL